jgi:alpha-ketoglutarate-dependent taurine dioxygenase
MNLKSFTIRKLTPSIGAEIDGVDLSAVSEAQLMDIRQALLDHLVIFFHDPEVDVSAAQGVGSALRSAPHAPGAPLCSRRVSRNRSDQGLERRRR